MPDPADLDMLRLEITVRARTGLLELLESVAPEEEGSVEARVNGAETGLWIWWDVQWHG